MRNNQRRYSYRIRLEKLKQETWRLVVLARFMLLLVIVISYCLRRD